jgi:hypothetical protein
MTQLHMLLFGISASFLACSGDVVVGSGGQGTSSSSSGSASKSVSSTSIGSSGSSSGSISSSSTGTPCAQACGAGLTCCDGQCVNTQNDPHNCGMCGNPCSAPKLLCDGTCVQPACTDPTCSGTCCGDSCCTMGKICCEVQQGGPSGPPACFDPVDGTCPVGCPTCL